MTGSPSSLELGEISDGAFRPLADGDIVDMVYGPQGGAMVGVALRLRGGSVPACLAQRTVLSATPSGELLDDDTLPRKTYEQADGSHRTHELFLILGYDSSAGDRVQVLTDAGGLTAERTLLLEFEGPDAGLGDAGLGDAGTGDAAAVSGKRADAAAMLDPG